MFAFAIWDARQRRLFLARDRFGKKPLYYAVAARRALFRKRAEVPAGGGSPLEVDEPALRLYFQFGTYPTRSVRSVRSQAAARRWLIPRTEPHRQERYLASAGSRADGACVPPEMRDSAPGSVRRDRSDAHDRRRAAGRVPQRRNRFELSGGVDGAAKPRPVKTFSIGFEESGFNELPYASLVAKQVWTEHHEILVRPNSVDLVSRLVRTSTSLSATRRAIPTFIVSEFAARHVKVALSGDGGDELFAGYERFAAVHELPRPLDRMPAAVRAPLRGWPDGCPTRRTGRTGCT